MSTFPDREWQLGNEDGKTIPWERVQLAILMDIRRELRELNRHLRCINVVEGMRSMRRIDRRLKKKFPLKD